MDETTPTTDGGGLSVEQAAEQYMSRISQAPAPSDEPPASAPPTDAGPLSDEAAGAEPADHDEPEEPNGASEGEPADTPAIEPPATWKPELRAQWAALPPDLQRELAQWEQERNSGVGQKLEAAAAQAKAAEAAAQAIDGERSQYIHYLNALATEILGEMGEEPDWQKLAAEDPAGYVQQKAQWDAHQQRLHRVFGQRKQVEDKMRAEVSQRVAEAQKEANTKLLEIMPGWRDAEGRVTEKAAKEFGEVMTYLGKEYGYEPDVLKGITDHRLVVIAHKARAYDELQKARPEVQKRVEQAPRMATPGAAVNQTQQHATRVQALDQKLRKTGSIDDAVALYLARSKRT